MDLRTLDTLVPAIAARGAIVEKGRGRCKVIGDYLNNHLNHMPNTCRSCRRLRSFDFDFQDQKIAAFGSSYRGYASNWRMASSRRKCAG